MQLFGPESVNYNVQPVDPYQAIVKGMQFRAFQDAQKAEQENKARFEEAKNVFFNNPNPTLKDSALFMSMMSPEQQQAFKPLMEQISEKEKASSLNFGLNILSALESNPLVGSQLLKERAEAEKNSGNAENAKFYEQLAATAEKSPGDAMKVGTLLLASIPGSKDALEGLIKSREDARKEALAPFEQKSEMALAQQRQTASQANLASAAESYAGVGLKKAQTQAAIQEKLPESIRTAEWFRNQSPEVQQNFKDVQLLRNPTTTVNVNNIDQAGEKALGNLIPEFYNKATSSFRQINEIQGYKKALSNAITGPLAEQRTALEEVMFSAGLSGSDGLTATTEIVKGLAKLALDSRQLISGQGQGTVTDSEQKLLTQAASAPQSLTKPQLKKVLEIAEKAAKANNKQNVDLLGRVATKSDTGQLFEESYYSVTGQEKPLKETKSSKQSGGTNENDPLGLFGGQ
jgi:hypothetical protein